MKKMTEEKLKEAVKKSISIAGALKFMEMSVTTGNYKSFHKKVKLYNIDINHFLGQSHLRGASHQTKKSIPLADILVEDSMFSNTASLKIKLLKTNLLKYECYNCGISSWKDKDLILQLDHINGIWNDNRLENLRLLCPNCHSQTETFAGRNINKNKAKETIIYYYSKCENCEELVQQKNTTKCLDCYLKLQPTKISWPSTKNLIKMVEESSYLAVGKKLGVSDNAVRKRIKNH
jgi:Zn finger protein HypA/HybF involved in hydrogenase expression